MWLLRRRQRNTYQTVQNTFTAWFLLQTRITEPDKFLTDLDCHAPDKSVQLSHEAVTRRYFKKNKDIWHWP